MESIETSKGEVVKWRQFTARYVFEIVDQAAKKRPVRPSRFYLMNSGTIYVTPGYYVAETFDSDFHVTVAPASWGDEPREKTTYDVIERSLDENGETATKTTTVESFSDACKVVVAVLSDFVEQ